MKHHIKGVVIDPNSQTVSTAEILANEDGTVNLDALYDALGCNLVDRFSLSSDADLVIDDEGLLKPNNPGFKIGDYPRYFAGKAIIFRVEGAEWTNVPAVNLEGLYAMIQWATPSDVQEQDMSVKVTTF
jgi:hypothetical protein